MSCQEVLGRAPLPGTQPESSPLSHVRWVTIWRACRVTHRRVCQRNRPVQIRNRRLCSACNRPVLSGWTPRPGSEPLRGRCSRNPDGCRGACLHCSPYHQLHRLRCRFCEVKPLRRLAGIGYGLSGPLFAVIGFALDNWIQSVAAVLRGTGDAGRQRFGLIAIQGSPPVRRRNSVEPCQLDADGATTHRSGP